jgi:hypothetical protein
MGRPGSGLTHVKGGFNVSNIISMDGKRGRFKSGGRWAPLKNVTMTAKAVERAMNRSPNLPGIVALCGPSGWGKSMCASYCANQFEGVYVECRSFFTKKTFALAILKEMGIRPARTLAEMMDQAAEQLDLSQRPLIIDEMDHMVDRNAIEIVRDLHEMSRTTMLLIGEEQFPRKLLQSSERLYNRVLVWQLAQPCSREDSRSLAEFYVPGVDIDIDLLDRVREVSRGVARTVCVNLDGIRNHCQEEGLKKINLSAWGKRELYSTDAPARRPT